MTDVNETDKKPDSVVADAGVAADAAAPAPAPTPEKRKIQDRIKDIEKRWGKEFTEVVVDLHDHIFGKSPHHDEDEAKAS